MSRGMTAVLVLLAGMAVVAFDAAAADAGRLRTVDASVSKPMWAASCRHSTLLLNTFISFFPFALRFTTSDYSLH